MIKIVKNSKKAVVYYNNKVINILSNGDYYLILDEINGLYSIKKYGRKTYVFIKCGLDRFYKTLEKLGIKSDKHV